MEFELYQYAIFFIAGFAGGFVDSIAGGGGLICLPALISMGMPIHMALATNKLQGTFGCLSATANFISKGYVDYDAIIKGIIFTLIGAVIGTTSVLYVKAEFLNLLIPILLLGIFIYTIFSPNLGEVKKEKKLSNSTFYLILGLALGFYDGFFGPGTGSFWTFAFVGFAGFAMKQAVANTKVMNLTSNLVSLVVFIIGGAVVWKVGFVMAAGQILGGYIGSNMVIKKDVKFIKRIFLLVVGATIIKILYEFFFLK